MSRATISALLAIAIGTTALNAQDTAQHRRCRDPHPAPVCAGYFLFEYNGGVRTGGSTITTQYWSVPALDSWFGWDVGWMKNWTPQSSLGYALEVGGTGDGVRLAVRAKSRHWLAHDFAIDASAGPLMTQFQTGDGEKPTYGLTADVGIGRARLAFLTLSADAAQQRGQMRFATHVGGRAESGMAGVISGLAVIGGLMILNGYGGVDYIPAGRRL